MSFHVSGKFPETAWRAAHNRQAAHVLLLPFLGSMRNRLAVNLCTARRYKPVIQFLGSKIHCLAVMHTRQATRVELAQFCGLV